MVEGPEFATGGGYDATAGIIHEGATEKTLTNDKGTPIHEAAKLGHEAVVKILSCVPDIDLNLEDGERETTLHRAVINKHKPVAKILMGAGINIDATDAPGRTALHLAVINQDEDMVRLLLKRRQLSTPRVG